MRTFDEIYLLNLHGNSKKKERAPDGGKDENVFDIQQGVAIGIFVRRQREPGAARNAVVHYADLWGEREPKYTYLAEQDVRTTEWLRVEPMAPFYLFTPRNMDLAAEYEQGAKITDIMPVNVLGFQSHRDQFAIAFDRDSLSHRIQDLRTPGISNGELEERYGIASSAEWKIDAARRAVQADRTWQDHILSCLYRPFDWRFGYFDEAIMDRPRLDVMSNMARPNLSLNVTRQTKADEWHNAVVANAPTPALYTEIKDGSNAFPLYLYPDTSKAGLWDAHEPLPDTPGHRRANLAPAFIADFAARLGMAWVPDGKGDRVRTFGPEDVFSYLYAVFHSPTYRERYAEFLKSDFPRLPLTGDPDLYRALCTLGDRLVGLHLMEQRADVPAPSFPVPGDNRVEQVRYTAPGEGPAVETAPKGVPPQSPPARAGVQAAEGRVWINRTQYFAPVPPEVWEFHIGGYQVCEKWLKDRKGRTLSYDDLNHYAATVAALAETRTLMDAIDEAIEDHGGWPLAGSGATKAVPVTIPAVPDRDDEDDGRFLDVDQSPGDE